MIRTPLSVGERVRVITPKGYYLHPDTGSVGRVTEIDKNSDRPYTIALQEYNKAFAPKYLTRMCKIENCVDDAHAHSLCPTHLGREKGQLKVENPVPQGERRAESKSNPGHYSVLGRPLYSLHAGIREEELHELPAQRALAKLHILGRK